jgi:hypothetical protein
MVDRQAARHPPPSGPHTGGAVRACAAGGRGLAGVWRVRRAVAWLGQPRAAASRRMPGRDCAARRPQPRPDRRREGLSTCVHECLADECLPGRAMSSIDTRTDRLRPRQIQLLPPSMLSGAEVATEPAGHPRWSCSCFAARDPVLPASATGTGMAAAIQTFASCLSIGTPARLAAQDGGVASLGVPR